jgi:hypothetical protein
MITHGEDPGRQALAGKLAERYGVSACLPQQFETISF